MCLKIKSLNLIVMRKKYLSFSWIVLLLMSSWSLQAQFRQILHQTFEVDSLKEVTFDVKGNVLIENWPGNLMMTETTVEIEGGSASIFNHFLKNGRYDILGIVSDSIVIAEEMPVPDSIQQLSFISKDSARLPIKLQRVKDGKVRDRQVQESVYVKIFLPEEFEKIEGNVNLWRRKPSEIEQTAQEQSVKKN